MHGVISHGRALLSCKRTHVVQFDQSEHYNTSDRVDLFPIYKLELKKIIAAKDCLYAIKTPVDFHKTFDSIFSAYTTCILKIFRKNKQTRWVRNKSCFITNNLIISQSTAARVLNITNKIPRSLTNFVMLRKKCAEQTSQKLTTI